MLGRGLCLAVEWYNAMMMIMISMEFLVTNFLHKVTLCRHQQEVFIHDLDLHNNIIDLPSTFSFPISSLYFSLSVTKPERSLGCFLHLLISHYDLIWSRVVHRAPFRCMHNTHKMTKKSWKKRLVLVGSWYERNEEYNTWWVRGVKQYMDERYRRLRKYRNQSTMQGTISYGHPP